MRFVLIFATCFLLGDCAKILGVFNHPGSSHTHLGKVLLKNLALKGHNVTMISSYPMESKLANYHDIELIELLEDMKQRQRRYSSDQPQGGFDELKNMTLTHTEATFRNRKVQNLLESNDHFDLIIIDFFYNEATWMFGHIYKAPIILMSSFGNNFLLNAITGNTLPYSYVPGGGLPINDDIPFKYRMIMSFLNLLFESIAMPRLWQRHHGILKKYFDNPPTIEQLSENIALVFTNSHFSIETPRPYTPNIIPIGGFHIEKPQPLPLDLQAFLDNATEGVIYFSLGSQIKSASLQQKTFKQILHVFNRLQQKILWKYETDMLLPEIPKNVKILKWIPQLGVLNHPNVKLFITHGGMLSITESIYFAIPMLCIPFNGDQLTNAAFIEARQLGQKVYMKDINDENFIKFINDLILNKKYKENVEYFSNLLRNQPMPPLDSAIYWTEHVIKYHGAPHLKPFSIKLPWYKYYMIDVIIIAIIVIWIICKIVKLIVLIIFKKCSNIVKQLKEKIE